VGLGVVDEGVEAAAQRGEPEAVVDELAPALLDLALEPDLLALEGDVLQLLVRGDQRDRPGRLVDLAALDPDQAVLDEVEPPDALPAGAGVELLDRLQDGDVLPVQRHRHPALEADHDLVRLPGHGRVLGVGVDVLDGAVPDVLEEAGLDGAAPHVLVDRVRRALGDVDRERALLGPDDRLLAGPGEVADRGEDLEVGSEGAHADLEADLVVALARAAVGDGRRAEAGRGVGEVLDDQRARERGDQRVAIHVERVGP